MPNAIDQELFDAVGKNDPREILLCLRRGANINARHEGLNEVTPLLLAAFRGHKEATIILLENYADQTMSSAHNFLPVDMAIFYNRLETAEIIKKWHHSQSCLTKQIERILVLEEQLLALEKQNQVLEKQDQALKEQNQALKEQLRDLERDRVGWLMSLPQQAWDLILSEAQEPIKLAAKGIVTGALLTAVNRLRHYMGLAAVGPIIGVHAGEVSLETHPLRDLYSYEERWLKSHPPENKTTFVSNKPLSVLARKPHSISMSDQKQEAKERQSSKDISSSFNQSLSANDYLGVVVPYVAHYTRKYSPFTLPWNRENSLSDQDRQQLNMALKKRNHLEKNIFSQQRSRVANHEFLSEKVSFVEKELCILKSSIGDLLKKGKASSSQLSEIQNKLERIEEVMKQLSTNNKKLRHFEAREKRLAKRSQKTGMQTSNVLHYTVSESCLTQEIVYDHSPLLIPAENVPLKMKQETESTSFYQLSHAQRFWAQPDPSPTAQAVQGKAEATPSAQPKVLF